VLALRFGAPPDRIRNPKTVPLAMTEEGAGPHSPFWPSSSNTNTGATIPSDFFMDSKLCGECHKDIYQQWNSSVHHVASFNNKFYRATILHMQELSGTQGSKWCAGCHDHAVFFNGQGAGRNARSSERAGVHVVPLDRAREQQHGQRRFHHRISTAP
jgi:hypothetical protein